MLRFAIGVFCAAAVLAAAATELHAQRGGGRGGIRVMTLTSPAFADGGMIPDKYAQKGRDVSPPLEWSGAPDSVASYVLIVRDIDAVSGDGTSDLLHWMVWGIPGNLLSLPEGMPQGPTIATAAPAQVAGGPVGGVAGAPAVAGGGRGGVAPVMRQLSVSGPYYRGPAAPASGPPHHYIFELYALDTNIGVQAGVASTAVTREAVMDAMRGRVRGKAVLVGRYRRPAP